MFWLLGGDINGLRDALHLKNKHILSDCFGLCWIQWVEAELVIYGSFYGLLDSFLFMEIYLIIERWDGERRCPTDRKFLILLFFLEWETSELLQSKDYLDKYFNYSVFGTRPQDAVCIGPTSYRVSLLFTSVFVLQIQNKNDSRDLKFNILRQVGNRFM